MAVTKQELEQENEALKAQLAEQSGGGQPHVHTAIQAILGELSVAKGGTLPANMGGKPYISAVDLNLEIKRRFVDQGLFIAPQEKVTHFQVLDGSRKQTFLVIQGTYTITSSKDGSSVTISGVGDGSAIGSAVTANIASTNALKNALLRTFLVTEQSAEDAAKETPNAGDEAASGNRDLDKAAAAAQAPTRQAPPPSTGPQTQESEAKRKVREEFLTGDDPLYTRDQVNAVMEAVKKTGARGDQVFEEVYRRLSNGELA